MIRAYANLIRKLHLCRLVPVRLMIVWPGFPEIYTSSENFLSARKWFFIRLKISFL